MITVHGGKPMFGLPNPSPFVMKTYIHLKMAGLEYTWAEASFTKAPKGKIPYINDDGQIIGDSHFIRRHIEEKYGFDFDKGHSAEALAIATMAERMAEERLYWVMVYERWAIDENFKKGPAKFFDAAPAPIRPAVKALIRRKVKKAMWAQGISRHTYKDILELAQIDLNALSTILGKNQWIAGDNLCGADAAVLAVLMGILYCEIDTDFQKISRKYANLNAYAKRGIDLYFHDSSLW